MVAYQLYSSRNFPPLSETCRMLAEAGIEGTEGFGGLYADEASLAETAAAINAAGLTMKTGHFGLSQIEDTPDWALKVARTLGMERLYVPYIMPADRPTDGAGWRAFGARLEKAFAPIRAAGYGTGWHNHDFEFIACADGSIPEAAILEGGPSLEIELDVAWVVRGGADPIAWIERYGSRITAAHVKDIAPKGENLAEDGWADVGQGVVDWKKLMAALKAVGCKNFVLEHDNPADHKRFATRSAAYVKGL
ncbi:sugar phosphate isomerase/epimerase family protein [Stagnihabitans tardus]|uniref:TIM barrel protein n=1 Tax=Stagnihabitans tardus TaxID=2699202 RepID=A0AAE4YDA9_9RHOB|nr:sugar phosphate isomerase/epimerase [Stagnihabitans tardus]NBZ87865.1 TIM barrel protein [Stagnihabitans tardus]